MENDDKEMDIYDIDPKVPQYIFMGEKIIYLYPSQFFFVSH